MTADEAPVVVRLGTRKSALAQAQARGVAAALEGAHAGLRVELVFVTTTGDRSQDTDRPAENWGSGVFVREIEAALLQGEVDIAVHSMKDLPPESTPGLTIGAVPARADPRDALVTADGRTLDALPVGARVGTASSRRVAFLRAVRPDLAFAPVRGNVDTRYRKLLDGQYDALVLALAGLDRLALDAPRSILDVDTLPPPPGQGALAVQVRAEDERMHSLVRALDDPDTARAVAAERQLMAALGGGCTLPVAALATPLADGGLELFGAVADPQGTRVIRARERTAMGDYELLARCVAAALRDQGAEQLLGSAPAWRSSPERP